jgi:hypothetical protein
LTWAWSAPVSRKMHALSLHRLTKIYISVLVDLGPVFGQSWARDSYETRCIVHENQIGRSQLKRFICPAQKSRPQVWIRLKMILAWAPGAPGAPGRPPKAMRRGFGDFRSPPGSPPITNQAKNQLAKQHRLSNRESLHSVFALDKLSGAPQIRRFILVGSAPQTPPPRRSSKAWLGP